MQNIISPRAGRSPSLFCGWARGVMLWVIAALGVGGATGTSASTVTLDFDGFSGGTEITTQYQTLGVSATSVVALYAFNTPVNAHSGPNIAASMLSDVMTFRFNPAIAGDVQSVSAYLVALTSPLSLFAYDAMNNLVAQGLVNVAIDYPAYDYSFVSLSTTGNPITTLEIHGAAATYVIDDVSFSTSTVPEPSSIVLLSVGIALVSLSRQSRKRAISWLENPKS